MKKNRKILCAVLALVLTAVFWMACFQVPALSQWISGRGNINMLVYAATLVLFCLCYLMGMLVTARCPEGAFDFLENRGVKMCVFPLVLVTSLVFLVYMLANETTQIGSAADRYAWHTQPWKMMLVIFLLEVLVFFWAYGKLQFQDSNGQWPLWILYGVLTALIFYCNYTPNIFGRANGADTFHGHAYFNSIYNVYWGMPYTGDLTSIYGHYALLWKIPMKLIGGDFEKFVFLMAVLTAAVYLCSFVILHLTVRSRLMRALGAVGISFASLGLGAGFYWQLYPHRMVFPLLLLLYAVLVFRKRKFGYLTAAGGYLISLLGVLWNTDTGVVIVLAWAAVHMSYCFSEGKLTAGRFVKNLIFHCAGVLVAFFGAYGIVNVYNLMKGSPANTVGEFLFPLTVGEYMTDVLHLDLPMYPSAYMTVMLLFAIGVAMGIGGWRWLRRSDAPLPWMTYFLFFLSVSALGRVTYYMNHPGHQSLICVFPSSVIFMAYLGEKGLGFLKQVQWKKLLQLPFAGICRSAVALACVAAILMTANAAVLQFGQSSQIKENYHNRQEAYDFINEVAKTVPAHTFGFGIGVAEVYSMLHWCTNCFTIDFSDISVVPGWTVKVIEQMQQEEVPGVFSNKRSIVSLETYDPEGYDWFRENYKKEKSFKVGGDVFVYYVRKAG